MFDISRSVKNILEKVCAQVSNFATSGLHEVVESLEGKNIKYAHISFCQEYEIKKANQFAHRMKMSISNLPESENEEVKSVDIKFLAQTLHDPNPDLSRALCIGNKEVQHCVIIVKFVDQA